MPSIAVITMDNYNDASRIIDGNFDDPRLTDYETLLENIHGLKAGKAVEVAIYDFKSSSRIGYRCILCTRPLLSQISRHHILKLPIKLIPSLVFRIQLIYILKSNRAVTVDQIRAVVFEEHKETTEETYDIYLLPPGEDPEACQSYLRMRNRDGKYNLMFEGTLDIDNYLEGRNLHVRPFA